MDFSWVNKSKSVIRFLLALAILGHLAANGLYSLASLYASSSNYPGDKPIAVHIDPFCAENGISRFGQVFNAWEYNKTENLSPQDLMRFDYLLFGNTTTEYLRSELMANFSSTHKEHFATEGFHRVKYRKFKNYRIPF